MDTDTTDELRISHEGAVALVEMNRPPHNFINVAFVQRLADTFDELSRSESCRAIVLMSGLKSFCAGADFSGAGNGETERDPSPLYKQAMRLFGATKPVIAAVQGPAIGAGMGLTLVADFRVVSASARFSANFTRLGFHPGFGMSLTLPRLIGEQKASLLFYTGRRIGGEEAFAMGLADELVADGEVRARAIALAQEIALSAPLAIEATRASLRQGLQQRIIEANRRELAAQLEHFRTEDFREGVAAMAQRRPPVFHRR